MLNGKIAIVTGATFGIGYETALGLAQKGAEVIVIGRDHKRTEDAVQKIKQESDNKRVSAAIADLSLIKEVKRLAQDLKAKYPRIDILINNAGGAFHKRQVTPEGFEQTWALNHLAYF